MKPLLALFGAAQVVLGLLLWITPGFFFDEIGPYGVRNDHYLGDLATWYLALGALALVAVRRVAWRLPVLALAFIQYALHSVNHLIDVGDAHPKLARPRQPRLARDHLRAARLDDQRARGLRRGEGVPCRGGGRDRAPARPVAGRRRTRGDRHDALARARRDDPRRGCARPRSSTRSTRTPCAPRWNEAAPEVVIHQLTSLPERFNPREAPRLRRHKPHPQRGHTQPPGRSPGGRRAPLRLPERRVRLRARRPARGQGRGGAARAGCSRAVRRGRARGRRDGALRAGCRRARGAGAALRLVLRAGHLLRRGRQHRRGPPKAPLPGRRQRRRAVVVRPRRRRCRRHRDRGRAGAPPASTTWSTTSPPPCATGCPPMPMRSARPRHGGSRSGWHDCSRARLRRWPMCCPPPRTPRPSASSAGSRAGAPGGTASARRRASRTARPRSRRTRRRRRPARCRSPPRPSAA